MNPTEPAANGCQIQPLPRPPFGPDTLACVLALAGTPTPTRPQLAAALAGLYPGGGPTVADVLAGGWLVPTVDGRGLRVPPLPLAEQDARLAAHESKTAFTPEGVLKLNTTAPAPLAGQDARRAGAFVSVNNTELAGNNRNTTGIEPAGNGRNRAGIEPAALAETTAEPLPKGDNVSLAPSPDNRREAGGEPHPAAPEMVVKLYTTPAAPRFSYYRGGIASTTPYAAITPANLYAVLVSRHHRARTEALRAAPVGSPQRAELKKRLDYVTPAGTFTRRANNGLENPSGLLVLDFDHVPDVAAARAALLADELLGPELVLVFTSPSGDGLKALVRADPTAGHLATFRAYADYLASQYAALGLVPDEAGKDVARACFVPYAPDAWLAPAYAAAPPIQK